MHNTSVFPSKKGTSPHQPIWAAEGIRTESLLHLDFHLVNLGCDANLLVVVNRETHLVSKGGVGLPSRGGAGSGLLHHLIDLLQRQALGLGNKEVGVDKATGTEGTPEEEHLRAQVGLVSVNQVWGDDGDDL